MRQAQPPVSLRHHGCFAYTALSLASPRVVGGFACSASSGSPLRSEPTSELGGFSTFRSGPVSELGGLSMFRSGPLSELGGFSILRSGPVSELGGLSSF